LNPAKGRLRSELAAEQQDCDGSVLSPSFGCVQFLRDALESVRGHDRISIEHVIQDGGSTDGIVEANLCFLFSLVGARR